MTRLPLTKRTRPRAIYDERQGRGEVAAQPSRSLLMLDRQPWEGALIARLQQDPPNIEAMLELYDHTARPIWSYALHRTGSKLLAKRATIAAFLTAAERPEVFDGRISVTARMLLILHLQTERRPSCVPLKRSRFSASRRGN